MPATLTDPIFTDPAAALAHMEASRWGGSPFCPHCGSTHVRKMGGKTQAGYWLCNDCRDKFTVRTGSVMERSHVPLNKWLLAFHLMAASKKGMSAHQMMRMLGVTYKTAWFLCHRIREAMRSIDNTPMGSGGGVVEADETFIGRIKGKATGMGYEHKMKVLSLLDRDTGRTRMMPIDKITVASITPILQANIAREAHLLTDDAGQYRHMHRHFASHNTTAHTKGNYVDRARPWVHTNTIEGSFSIFKRGMKGIYQHCSSQHLHRYLAEFDFRYTNRSAVGIEDDQRAELALLGSIGKRLMYRQVTN